MVSFCNEKGQGKHGVTWLSSDHINTRLTSIAPAVRIEDHRDEFLAIASQWGCYGRQLLRNFRCMHDLLTFAGIQPRGGLGSNITSFVSGQDWDRCRDRRPDVLFIFQKESIQVQHPPSKWYHVHHGKRKRVISPDNHHVLYYPECPMTISSKCEPWRLEALRRLNPGLTNIDLYYRMPPTYEERKGGTSEIRDLLGLTAMTNELCRWRPQGSCIALNQRKGSKIVFNYIYSKMSEEDKADNSTLNSRDLTPEELGELKRLMKDENRKMDPKKSGAFEAEDLDDSDAEGDDTWGIGNYQQSQTLLVSQTETRQQTARQPVSGKRGQDDFLKDDEINEVIDETLPPTKRHHRTVVTPNPKSKIGRHFRRPSKHAGQKKQGVTHQRMPYQRGRQAQPLTIDKINISNSGHGFGPDNDFDSLISPHFSGISTQSLDALETNIEDVLLGNESQPTQQKPTQKLVNIAGESCASSHPAVMCSQAKSSDPRSIEGERTTSLAVHRDQVSNGITPRSHQDLAHAMPNALAPRPQNQSKVPPKVSYRENPTHLGKRRRDEPPEHESVDEGSPAFKKPFLPSHRSTTTLPDSAVRTTTETDRKMASARLQGRQPSGPHTLTKRLEQNISQSSETYTSRLGPVIPPAYLALPGFSDPRIFRPAAGLGHTSPQHDPGKAFANGEHAASASGGRSRNLVVEAHLALQQALVADGSSTSSSGQGFPHEMLKAVDNQVDRTVTAFK